MSFTNYSYKNTGLTTLINGIDNAASNDNNVKNAFNAGPITNSVVPFTSIDETPKDLNFKYKDTDISDYSIAYYQNNFSLGGWTHINIPTWCNKVRLVGCGGGGGGGRSTSDSNGVGNYYHHGHYFTYWGQLYYYDYQGAYYYQKGEGKPGAGGGAGGFFYVTRSVSTQTGMYVWVGGGGATEMDGAETKVWENGVIVARGYGGKKGYRNTRGEGGEGTTKDGDDGDNTNGDSSGQGGEQSRTKSGSYGRGGNGPSGSYTSTGDNQTNDGTAGNNGYAIIYFIKDN